MSILLIPTRGRFPFQAITSDLDNLDEQKQEIIDLFAEFFPGITPEPFQTIHTDDEDGDPRYGHYLCFIGNDQYEILDRELNGPVIDNRAFIAQRKRLTGGPDRAELIAKARAARERSPRF